MTDHTRHEVLSQFRRLSRALIDASSIIYMHKAGFFRELSRAVNLYSPPEIVAETGLSGLNIRPIAWTSNSLSNDQKLIAIALKLKRPVISEDKSILLQMHRARLPYFNTLMMLDFLVFRRRIDLNSHAVYFERLKGFAWYSTDVWEFGKNIHNAIADLS